jgi:periplasmic protein TonB
MSQRKWTDDVSRWLIHHAACRAPESLSQRLEEEWQADSAERTSATSRLRQAIGCCWAAGVIALEYLPSRIPVASSGMEGKLVNAYAEPNFGFSRRSTTLFLVVSLHAVVFYAVLTSITVTHRIVPPTPLQNRVIENPHPTRIPPPVTPTLLKNPTLEVPRPYVEVPQDPDRDRDVRADFDPEPLPPVLRPPPPHEVKQVQGGPGAGFPNPDDFYPAPARYLEEQGIATVQVCVDAHGRLMSDPTTLQGTGSRRLDEGALKLARAGSGHYRPSTDDGKAVNSCYALRIRFQLKK